MVIELVIVATNTHIQLKKKALDTKTIQTNRRKGFYNRKKNNKQFNVDHVFDYN